MAERVFLTQQIVDRAEPPESGERWIADSKIRGFGLRLWKTRKGSVGRAYCVRVANKSGKSVRQTLSYWMALERFRQKQGWNFDYQHWQSLTLGQIVDIAREWALDEIAIIKGRQSLSQELELHEAKLAERAALLTLSRAADIAVRGMRVEGRSTTYCDRLDKLFSHHVPTEIADLNICEVTSDQIELILTSSHLSHGNLNILRPFLRRVIEIPNRYGVRTAVRPRKISRMGKHEIQEGEKLVQVLGWTKEQYASLFEFLGSQTQKWQQAYCLRFYLLMDAPLSKLMSARWDDVYVYEREDGNEETPLERYEWRYNESWRGRVSIRAMNNETLKRCFRIGREEFGDTPFWFPSPYERTTGHIRSVDHMWRLVLAHYNLTYVSPRVFREVFRQSYLFYGLDKFGPGPY